MKSYHASQISTLEYKNKAEKFCSLLSPKQYSSVMYYSDGGHKRINYASSPAGRSLTQDIHEALQLTQPYQKTVYRASDDFKIHDLHVGKTISFPAFVSTSYNPQITFKFLNKQTPIIYIIDTTQGAEISLIHNEMEVLLPQGLNFEIISKQHVDFYAAYPDTDYHISRENITVIHLQQKD